VLQVVADASPRFHCQFNTIFLGNGNETNMGWSLILAQRCEEPYSASSSNCQQAFWALVCRQVVFPVRCRG
jgi:hypothetical protein